MTEFVGPRADLIVCGGIPHLQDRPYRTWSSTVGSAKFNQQAAPRSRANEAAPSQMPANRATTPGAVSLV